MADRAARPSLLNMGLFSDLGMDRIDAWINDATQRHELEEQRRTVESTHHLRLQEDEAPWTADSLGILDGALGRVGPRHVEPIDRIVMGGSDVGDDLGLHFHDKISLSSSPLMTAPSDQYGGCTSVLGGHEDPVTWMGTTVVHEVGHDIERHHPDQVARFLAAGGWEEDLDSSAAGLSAEQVETIQRDGKLVVDGVAYQLDRQAMAEEAKLMRIDPADVEPRFVDYPEGYLPAEPTSCVPATGEGAKRQAQADAYRRSGPHEYFADMFSNAVSFPEMFYDQHVTRPAAAPRAADPTSVEWAEASDAAAHKLEQFQVMREIGGVTDELVADRVHDLVALSPATDARELAQLELRFRSEAAKAITPGHLDRLLDAFLERDVLGVR